MTTFKTHSRHLALLAAAFSLAACNGASTEEPDAGGPPPDVCNSKEEAFGAGCLLTLGGEATLGYIGAAGDQDWYGIQMPSSVTPRSLLHLSGGYGVPNTAVNLSFNVLLENGATSIGRVIDNHGQAAPKPMDLIIPFSQANAKLLVQVADEPANPARPSFDWRSQYAIKAEVVENPDINEPNDITPTPILIESVAGVPTGATKGYLATTDDVDRFTFTVPNEKILYLHLTAPKVTPPPPFRLAYLLRDSMGTPVAEGRVDSEALPVDLATARVLTPGATYSLTLQPYRAQGSTGSIAGDLRVEYSLSLQFYSEQDVHEPNGTAAQATALPINSPGNGASATGRLGYVPDLDWYSVDLPAHSASTVLRVKLSQGSGGGRFAALPGPVDRTLRVLTQVTGPATQPERVTACQSDPVICPKGYDGRTFLQQNVESLCANNDPPLCLRSERIESVLFSNLKNFEAALPVPAHASTVRYLILVQDSGNDFADDRDYVLSVDWQADADESARIVLPEATEQRLLLEDSAAASFPAPPAGNGYEMSGTLSHGYGRLFKNDPNRGEGIRGTEDYDAVPTDVDRYELAFPAITPADKTWMIQWDIANQADGGTVGDLSVEVEFCDGVDGGTATCKSVSEGSKGSPLVLAYTSESLATWHNSNGASSTRQAVYDRASTGPSGTTTVTGRAYGCFCFESRFVQGGKFFLKVGALDRRGADPLNYVVRSAFTDYPKSYSTTAGMQSCPAPAAGGCQFTKEP